MLDLVVATQVNRRVNILLGNGNGTFESPYSYVVPSPAVQVGIADFNGDGIPDIFAIAAYGYNSGFLQGNGIGGFTVSSTSLCGPGCYPVMATGRVNLPYFAGNAAVSASHNIDSGGGPPSLSLVTYSSGTVYGSTGIFGFPELSSTPISIAIGDFNGDGETDVAAADAEGITVFLSNGLTGTAWAYSTESLPIGGYLAVGDFNGDGKADLAVMNPSSGTVTILLGNGDGTFSTAGTTTLAISGPLSVADLNGDGLTDLVVAQNYSNTIGFVSPVLTQPTETATATASGVSAPGLGSQLTVAYYGGDTNFGYSYSEPESLIGSAPVATLSTNSVTFPLQAVGISSGVSTITLTNTGGSLLHINSIKLGGTNASSFVTSNTCGTGLVAGAACNIGVRFVPLSAGTFAATITLINNASDSPQVITLTGTSFNAPVTTVSLSAALELFGTETVGVSTGSQNVVLTNTGTNTLYFGLHAITLGGANASSFVTSNTCTAIMAPGARCTIGARFVPTTTGPLTATITLNDNVAGSPQVITLKGTGK